MRCCGFWKTKQTTRSNKALNDAQKNRGKRLERVRARQLAEQERNRAELQTDLKAASLEATRGQPQAARQIFEDILKLEPDWPEALESYATFLFDQSIQSKYHGTLQVAMADADRCLALAEHLDSLNNSRQAGQRVLSAALNQQGDLLRKRGQPGDAEQAFQQYTRSLDIDERLLRKNADAAEAARSVVVRRYTFGEFEAQQERFDTALKQFGRGIEVLEHMQAKQFHVDETTWLKAILEERAKVCQLASMAIGDWDTLLKAEAALLPSFLWRRASLLAVHGKLADVAQAGAKLRELAATADSTVDADNPADTKSGMLYNAACAYSLCATLAVNDKPDPTETELAEHKKFIDLALACLKEAIAAGFDSFDHMQQDSDLTPLHDLPEFQQLLPPPTAVPFSRTPRQCPGSMCGVGRPSHSRGAGAIPESPCPDSSPEKPIGRPLLR